MPAQTVIKLRRGTASQWTSANPVLSAGEIGLETNTNRTKYGDGSTAWSSLPYSVADASGTSSVDWSAVLNKPSTFTPSSHTHVKADVTDFAHTHVMADITDLEFPPTTVMSDTAPTSPAPATRWVNTTNFIEYIYYDSTWVEV
jgi:hypothetical protein